MNTSTTQTPIDQSSVGLSGVKKTIKHTIMAKPKEIAVLVAVLVVIVAVLAYMAYRKHDGKKSGFMSRDGHSLGTSNFRTGGNSPMWALGSIQGQESTQRDEAAKHGIVSADQVSNPMDVKSLMPLESASSAPGMSGLLGSACQAPSSDAEEELASLQQVGVDVASLGTGSNQWSAPAYLAAAKK